MKLTKRILIVAVAMGLVSVVFLSYYINSLDKPAHAVQMEKIDTVVASGTIPAHTRLTSDMLEVRSISADAVHPDSIGSLELLEGGITTSLVIGGEQVISSKVVTEEGEASLSYRIPEGMRAVALPADDISSVAGYISPEDKVDILVTYSDSEIADETVTQTKFQNVEVLASGSLTIPKQEPNREGDTLIVAVSPEQAEVLAYAYQKGTFHFTLRAPQDDGEASLSGYSSRNFDSYEER